MYNSCPRCVSTVFFAREASVAIRKVSEKVREVNNIPWKPVCADESRKLGKVSLRVYTSESARLCRNRNGDNWVHDIAFPVHTS